MALGLRTFGYRCTLGLWPLLPYGQECLCNQTDTRPTRAEALHDWKPTAGGRVLCWDGCLSGLQALQRCDPVQHRAWILDCCMDTESSTSQVLRELLGEDGNSETPENTFQRGRRSVFVADQSSKKTD